MTFEQALAKLQDPDAQARLYAIRWLRVLGGERAVAALIGALDDPDPNGAVPHHALTALGQMQAREAVPVLIERVQRKRPAVWRSMYIDTLGQIGDPRALPALIGALDDPEKRIVEAACGALGAIKDSEAVPALIAALDHPQAATAEAAFSALGQIGDRRALPALIASLDAPDGRTIEAACGALSKLGAAEAVEPLLQRLGDPAARVRFAACEALFELRVTGDRLRGALQELAKADELSSPSARFVETTVAAWDSMEALGERPPFDYLERLEQLGRWIGEQQRGRCRWMLRKLARRRTEEGSGEADTRAADEEEDEIEGLKSTLAELRTADPDRRENAARSLGPRDAPEAELALIRHLLSDESARVRKACAWQLEQFPGEAAADALRQALSDPDPGVIHHAGWVLGDWRDRQAIPLLLPLLDHPDRRNRLSAAKALVKLEVGDERLVETLEKLALDPEADEHDLEALEFNSELEWRREWPRAPGEPEPQPRMTMAELIGEARRLSARAGL